ncbi:zinc ribbon domain-containing protein [Streptomyces sp. TS71-3]|uniref:zinc ribbon domain-containing protein n=1 Tax=Streptomyces sp. TS71-3 TaxID=2733862 RepID=UPI002016CC5E|nr:zinc ribbon domain-containing protein [Streptomyces sp. TS71-3]
MQPAKPAAARPVVRQSAAREPDSGVPCPSCGTLNQPGRKFCRRCATRLDAPEPVAALPWWRTRWPFRRRVRIGGSGRWGRRLLALLVVVALVVAGFLLLPAGRGVVEDVRDKLGDASAISPSNATASASVPGHPAAAAIDSLTNRYWGAPALGASVTFTFERPFRLVDLVVHTGPSADPGAFRREARPTRVDLVVTSADGTEHTQQVSLNDKPGPQTIATGISDVVTVRLVLREAAGLSSGRHLAVGEVEFFKRS